MPKTSGSAKNSSKASAERAASRAGTGGFIGFDAFSGGNAAPSSTSASGSVAGSAESSLIAASSAIDDASTVLSQALVLAFRRAAKRDSTTKLRALSDLAALFTPASLADDASLDSALRVWARLLPLLVADSVRAVRRSSCAAHHALVVLAGRRLAPHLAALMPPWLAALFDPAPDVQSAARAAFDAVFTTDDKRVGALAFTADAMVVHLRRTVDGVLLFRSAVPTRGKKDAAAAAESDAGEAASNAVLPLMQAIRAVEHCVRSLSAPTVAAQHAGAINKWLAVLLADDELAEPACLEALFSLADSHFAQLHAPLMSLVATLAVHQRGACAPHAARIAAPVLRCFGAVDAASPLREVFQATIALLKQFGAAVLPLDDGDKLARSVGAGLLTMLRQAGFQAPHILYAGLQPLLAHLPAPAWSGGQAQFASRVLAGLWSGLDADAWQSGNESMLFDAYVECLPLLAAKAAGGADADVAAFVVNSAAHVVSAALAPKDCALQKWPSRVAVVKRVLSLQVAGATPAQLCALLATRIDALVHKQAPLVDGSDSPLMRCIDVLGACAELGAASTVQATAALILAQLAALPTVTVDVLAALAHIARHFAAIIETRDASACAERALRDSDAAVVGAALDVLVACAATQETRRVGAIVAAGAAGPGVLCRLLRSVTGDAAPWRCAELTALVEQQLAVAVPSSVSCELLATAVTAALLPEATLAQAAEAVARSLPTRTSFICVAGALLSTGHRSRGECAELLFETWATADDVAARDAARAAFAPALRWRDGVSIDALVRVLHRVATVESAPCGELVRAILGCAAAQGASAAACAKMLPVLGAADFGECATLASALAAAPFGELRRAGVSGRLREHELQARLVRLAPLVFVELERGSVLSAVSRDWLWLPAGFALACLAVGGIASVDVVGAFVASLVANEKPHFSEQWLVDAVVDTARAATQSSASLSSLTLLLEAARALPAALLRRVTDAIAAELIANELSAEAVLTPTSVARFVVALPFVAAHCGDTSRVRACVGAVAKRCVGENAALSLALVRSLATHAIGADDAAQLIAACEPLFGERWWSTRQLDEQVECVALVFAAAEHADAAAAPTLKGDLWLSRVAQAVGGVAAADTAVETTHRATAIVLLRALVRARASRGKSTVLDGLLAAVDDSDKAAVAVHEPIVDLFAELVDVRDDARDEPFAVLLSAAADCVAGARIAPLPDDESEGNSRVRELFMQFVPILSREDSRAPTLLSQAAAHNVLLQAAQQFAALCKKRDEDNDIVVDGDKPIVDRDQELEEQSLPTQLRLALSRANDGRGNASGLLLLWSVTLEVLSFHGHNTRQHASAFLRRGERMCGVLTRLFDEVDETRAVPLAAVPVLGCVDGAIARDADDDDDVRPFAPLAARLFLRTALQLPVLLRSWYRSVSCPRRMVDKATTYVTRFVGEIVIAQELARVQDYILGGSGGGGKKPHAPAAKTPTKTAKGAASDDDDDSDSDDDDDDDDDDDGDDSDSGDEFSMRVFRQARQVVAQYETDDIDLSVTLTLPVSYPLDLVNVESTTRFGVSEAQWRRWVLSITSIFMSQDGSVLDACLLWKENLNKHFSGVEPCPICYSVLHLTNNQLPKMACSNCKNVFHSSCLFAWFAKSHKSQCPLCSAPF
jgi:hypothetical protein